MFFRKKKKKKKFSPFTKWKHEVSSARIFELLCDNNHIDIEKEDLNLVQDLILGDPPQNLASSLFLTFN